MPPKSRRLSSSVSSSNLGPVRRPVVGAAAAKAKTSRPSSSTQMERVKIAGMAKKATVGAVVESNAPAKKKISRSPSMSMASSKFSLEQDGRVTRLSSDEYMDSASSRMAKLQKAMGSKKPGKKSNANEIDDAADAPAMSMSDLLASLDDVEIESSGQTDLGVFSAHILQFSSNLGIVIAQSVEQKAGSAAVMLKCQQDHLLVEDDSGTYETDPKYPAFVTSLHYRDLKTILYDHQHSSLKIRTIRNEFLIVAVENSLELEQELTKRFAQGIDEGLVSLDKIPNFSYLGMFAGPTKPKPFERKRANLTQLKQSKMPALTKMREIAVERHNGPERPMPMEFSRRTMIALDHIHEGQTIFPVFSAALPQIVYCHNAVLVMDDEGMVFENDTLNSKLSLDESKRTICLFEDVSAWGVYDLGEDVTENGVQLDCKDIQIFFAVDDINNFRVCFEYFWNLHRTRSLKLSAQPGTTHGRKVMGIHTLMGEVRAPDPLEGNYQVVDVDGKVLKANAAPKRKKSFVEKVGGAIFGMGGAIPTSQRGSVRPHWGKVVMHNGWLLKQGGMMKSWIKRYFVLYKTGQGHFLSYYSQYWESPLYNPDRKERNMIDLCKVTFLRARSKNRDAPLFSFDIATIEREWTLCADSNEDLQLWLQLIASAVDEDVAIVPDDTLSFMVKARLDPSLKLDTADYKTVLQVSTWGVSVQKLIAQQGYETRKEIQFWCYTDFYKWYVMKQNNKTALSVQIFSEGNFKKKMEWVFRTPDAERISTAIEYYIEKFMTRMHLRRELEEAMAPPPPPAEPDEPPQEEPAKAAEKTQEGAVGAGDAGDYEFGKRERELPTQPPLLPATFEEAGNVAPSEYTESNYGDDLGALFDEEDEVMSMHDHEDLGLRALFDSDYGSEMGSDPNSNNDWISDEEQDEDDLLYSTYDIGLDVMDVDEPATLERAFDPSNNFFEKGYPAAKIAPEGEVNDVQCTFIDGYETEALKAHCKFLFSNIQGPLVKDEIIDIYYRHEYRGSQARITFIFRNMSSSTAITNFKSCIKRALPCLRSQLPMAADSIQSGKTQTQMALLDLYIPFNAPPELELTFSLERTDYKYILPLPLSLSNFLSPVMLTADEFRTRWEAMEASEVAKKGPCKKSMDPANCDSLQGALRIIKLGIAHDALDGDGCGLCCAAALHTRYKDKSGVRVVLGCLAKVLVKNRNATVAVRSPDVNFPPVMAGHMLKMLEPAAAAPQIGVPEE